MLPGRTANFYCSALSHGLLVYDWKKVDNSLPYTATKSFVYKSYIGRNATVYQLAISNTQTSDEGEYCCVAQSEGGATTKCASLNIKGKLVRYYRFIPVHIYIYCTCIVLPKFTKQPVSVTVRAGDVNKVAMSCAAAGGGPLSYRWEKYQYSDNSWTSPSQRVVNITSSKLLFAVVAERDEGVYRCVVTNEDGSIVSNNATITVYGE